MATENDTAQTYLIRLTVDQIETLQGYAHFYGDDYCVGDDCRQRCEDMVDYLEQEMQRVQAEAVQ